MAGGAQLQNFGGKVLELQQRSYNDCALSKRKLVVAAVAGLLAWVVVTAGVDIDPTMETLIVGAAPLIVAYWWPMPLAKSPGANDVVDWDFKSGIGFATIGTLIIYFGVQFILGTQEATETKIVAAAPAAMAGFRMLIAVASKG